jgi:polyphosphate kinase
VPKLHPVVAQGGNLFDAIGKHDIVLHHPFESFAPVVEFARQAALDPEVLAIKQTLYRTGKSSPFVNSLIEAAHAGKDVTVVIELRARFDEEANIGLANRLQEAGVQVVYGVVGYKTHAKMILVVRREAGGKLRRYVHLGTGNYHSGNAAAYTDIGLLTAHRDITEDVHNVFQQLSGLGPVLKLKKLLHSPFTLHRGLLERIDREADFARKGKPARIRAKMNALSEVAVIQALYRASQAGVDIELIVRGICALRPGVKGVSERIKVHSVVGRFLEHSRVFWFENDGEPEIFASSADWMDRNLLRRVEVCFPLLDLDVARRVYNETLETYAVDNLQGWELRPDGTYERIKASDGQMPYAAQQALLTRLTR